MSVQNADGVVPLRLTKTILFWLGFVGIFNPMATDIYLPALPRMAEDFGTSPATVQLGLATSSLGMAIGTLFVGILSDRFGRRKPLISTGILMVVAASMASLSPNVVWFLACCLLMGFAASSVQVAGRGVVADITIGRASTRAPPSPRGPRGSTIASTHEADREKGSRPA